MALFGSNDDSRSIAPDQAATGPLIGFLDAFQTSLDAQMRTGAQFAIETYMHELDWQQKQALEERGVADAPQLLRDIADEEFNPTQRNEEGYYPRNVPGVGAPYLDVARFYARGEDSPAAQRMKAYDERIKQLQRQYPDMHLRTSEQLFAKVRKDAQDAERADATQNRSFGGSVGGFAGAAIGSMNPQTDPLNFWTLGIGGAGRTALTRIGSEMLSQGAIETINQFTGVQEERDLMGLSSGFGNAALQIGATALGAGALQGLAEGVGRALGQRRGFRDVPNDPAPPPEALTPPTRPERLPSSPERIVEEAQAARLQREPNAYLEYIADQTPLSGIRQGRTRTLADVADMTSQLDDWRAGSPATLTPRTADVSFPGSAPRTAALDTSRIVEEATSAASEARRVEAARAQDPKAFSRYDRIVQERNTMRRWIDELRAQRGEDVQGVLDTIDGALDRLEAKLRTTQGKNAKAKIKRQIAEARADREKVVASAGREGDSAAQVRAELTRLDEEMRNLAPLIGRAYARAEGKWAASEADMQAVWDAYRAGRTEVRPTETPTLPTYDQALTLADRAPVMRRADTVEEGATVADTASNVAKADIETLDEAVQAHVDSISQYLAEDADGKVRIGDHEFDLKDKVFVPDEAGTGTREVTVRQLLQEDQEAKYEMEALTTCSIPLRS